MRALYLAAAGILLTSCEAFPAILAGATAAAPQASAALAERDSTDSYIILGVAAATAVGTGLEFWRRKRKANSNG